MVQEAIVTKNFPHNLAEVAVTRATACGKSCSSCESCMFQNELKVIAENPFSIETGKKVLIETKTLNVFCVIVLVYLLPMIAMLAVAILLALLGASEVICVVASFSAFAISVIVTIVFHGYLKRKSQIVYTIVKELN